MTTETLITDETTSHLAAEMALEYQRQADDFRRRAVALRDMAGNVGGRQRVRLTDNATILQRMAAELDAMACQWEAGS
jgi:hypothetical protein